MKLRNAMQLALVLAMTKFSFVAAAADPIEPPVVPIKDGWSEIKPGGNSLCARGGEYAFYYYKGKSDKLVVDFMGGGACWSEETCRKDSAIFWDSVDDLRAAFKRGLEGIYNHLESRNPVADWSHIVIPYCTGDIHWGDSEVTYGKGEKAFTIHHNGAVNARIVLDWVNRNLSAPEKILVTGFSGGSYGSIYWTPFIHKRYPQAELAQLGDSGVGVITQDFFHNNFSRWRAEKNAPTWIPAIDPNQVDWYSLSSSRLYNEIGKFYPEIRLAQYTTAFDNNQIFFFEAMGGGGEVEWNKEMRRLTGEIAKSLPNFSYYIGAGETHCIMPYDLFYTKTTENVKFMDWFDDYINNRHVDNVSCKGLECDPISQ